LSRTLRNKLLFKIANADTEGLKVFLTEEDIQQKLDEAGITVDDWRHDGYHLSRVNDEGDYRVDNCRFLPAEENYAEKKVSAKMKAYYESQRDNSKLQNAKTPEQIREYASRGGKAVAGKPRKKVFRAKDEKGRFIKKK